jgi:hypothetical protein
MTEAFSIKNYEEPIKILNADTIICFELNIMHHRIGKPRKRVSQGIQRKLLIMCRGECPICHKYTEHLEIHYINHYINQNRNDNRPENLIPLCPDCHSKADSGSIEY